QDNLQRDGTAGELLHVAPRQRRVKHAATQEAEQGIGVDDGQEEDQRRAQRKEAPLPAPRQADRQGRRRNSLAGRCRRRQGYGLGHGMSFPVPTLRASSSRPPPRSCAVQTPPSCARISTSRKFDSPRKEATKRLAGAS